MMTCIALTHSCASLPREDAVLTRMKERRRSVKVAAVGCAAAAAAAAAVMDEI